MKYSLDNYKGKKVFITGHTGFKGFWLVAMLHKLGAIVKGYALEPMDQKDAYQVCNGDDFCESVISDVRDKSRLENEIVSFNPDYVFHLAAQSLVRRSYQNPSETFEVNIIGTSNLLEIFQKHQINCSVVVITTDKVYENLEDGRLFTEGDRLGGHDPYSTSKACVELVVESFNKSFFLNPASNQTKLATARAGNVIGGGDYSVDRLLPDFVRAAFNKEKLLIRNPNATRPWQHVLEPLTGYLMLGIYLEENKIDDCRAFNFGPETKDHLTVKELLEIAKLEWPSVNYEIIENSNLHEAGLLKLNILSAKEKLGWNPKLDARKAIKLTMDWYKADDKKEMTMNQISHYLNL